MEDSADKKLTARYKEVFDHYRDDGAAEGWALLQQKRKKPKPFPYYWLSGAAALLLLAVGLGWYFMRGEQGTGNRKEEMVNGSKWKVESGKAGVGSSESGVRSSESGESLVKNRQLKKDRNLLAEKTSAKLAEAGSRSYGPVSSPEKLNADAVFLSAKTARTDIENTFAQVEIKSENLLADPTANLFADEKSPVKTASVAASNNKAIKNNDSRRALALSVFAGSQVNYGRENTRKTARPTGGLQAELALGKRFSIGLGAGVADYQLAYNDGLPALAGSANPPAAAAQNNAVSVSGTSSAGKRTPSFIQNTSVSAPPSNDITASFVTYRFVSTSSIELNRVTARFTAIEIPLAFSWKALTGKTGLALTAAVNSSWMIREAYVADLSIQNFNGTETPVNSQRNEDTFTGFTPFSSLQFSVGMQPGGQTSRLSIEPFARFPLQNQGLEQLRYGAAGLNLKFRLNNTHKK